MRMYGVDGLPITGDLRSQFEAAAEVLADHEGRRVGYDELVVDGVHVRVSTVFIVWDANFSASEHLPVLYETLIDGGHLDERIVRYDSREAAQVGHAAAVEAARSGVDLRA